MFFNRKFGSINLSDMKYLVLLLLLFTMACSQNSSEKLLENGMEGALQKIESISDPIKKEQAALEFWNTLSEDDQIPYTHDSTVVFLYYGEAESVAWNGDFNSWGENPTQKFEGKNIPGTKLWFVKKHFPSDARFDYKVTLNGEDWILDPANPHQQVSGFGPNSELRMPDWKEEPLTTPLADIETGTLLPEEFIQSSSLEYEVSYRVYTPAGYENLENLNVIYVTDGQEYSDPEMGAMVTVLDNLHHLNKIEPTISVFVSPLAPDDEGENRRMDEFGNNPAYLDFYTKELIPKVESTFEISKNRSNRAILGTSLGGLNATYFAFSHPDLFQNIGIQAPAYWYREEIYDLVKSTSSDHPVIFMSVGTVADNTMDARLMKSIFTEKGYTVHYLEVNEGHSWGTWRAQIDDILVLFFGK